MAERTHASRVGSASLGLAVLSFINLFNYLDRYVVSAVVESLKRSELALSDAQLGSLMTAFLIVYTITAPFFGVLGDRRSRPRLIALGVGVWSVATTLSGFAGSFLALFAARAAVGVGEAAYVTIAPSLLSDYYSAAQRARVMAIFFCAIPVGSALGYVVGGLLDVHFGWRVAFFVSGGPGLILAALCLRLHDPPRGAQDPGTKLTQPAAGSGIASIRATYSHLVHNKPYVLTVLGYTAYTFAMGGLAYWMPAFLERMRGIPHGTAAIDFGKILVITGFVGTFAGGWLGDYCIKYSRQAFLWLSAIATLIAVPFAWVALTTGSNTVYTACMVGAQLCMFLSTGPINAAIVNLVSPLERASAIALSVFVIHALGDAISPYLIGAISDASSLDQAVKIVPVGILVSGLIWCWAARAQASSKAHA